MPKKKYSINWEDDAPTSFEVDGVQYPTLEAVPDEADRRRLTAMLDSSEAAEFEAEFAQAQKELEAIQSFPVEKVVLGVFAGVALIMLLVAGIATWRNIQKLNREQSVPGKVVDMLARPDYADNSNEVVGEIYFPTVEYVVNDKRYTVPLNEGSDPPMYAVGDEVTILYEPENPQEARIQSAGSSALMWILPSITGILGIAFLVAVLAVRKVMGSGTDGQSQSG